MVYREGEAANTVYIVKNGEFEVLKRYTREDKGEGYKGREVDLEMFKGMKDGDKKGTRE